MTAQKASGQPTSLTDMSKLLAVAERRWKYSDQEFQRVNRELRRLEYEYHELVAQRNELIWALEQHNSIKKLAKILAARLHQRILFSIDKLQQPHRRARTSKLTAKDFEKLSTIELLQVAKNYDDRYLKTRNPYLHGRYYLYLAVKAAYRLMTRTPKAIYKSFRYVKRKAMA